MKILGIFQKVVTVFLSSLSTFYSIIELLKAIFEGIELINSCWLLLLLYLKIIEFSIVLKYLIYYILYEITLSYAVNDFTINIYV